MGHEIDLKNYKIHTDLAIESIDEKNKEGIHSKIEKISDVTITNVYVDKIGSEHIGKKEGTYITIEFDDVTDFENSKMVEEVFGEKLKEMLDICHIKKEDTCLVIGLGNEKSTPDALGPLSLHHILVTNHLWMLGSLEEGFRPVCALTPGVMGETGIETSDVIGGVIEKVHPDFVLAIDALASSSVERVNKTIQMTDTGIHPGSGIGNSRKEISKEILGIPVIAIGVPTVVDAVTIVNDTIHYMYQHFAYMKENIHNPLHRLIPSGSMNYLNKEIKENKQEKQKLLGMVGGLEDAEMRELLYEVLSPIGYNLMVTPKEVDFVIEKLSMLIASGINHALHEKVDFSLKK